MSRIPNPVQAGSNESQALVLADLIPGFVQRTQVRLTRMGSLVEDLVRSGGNGDSLQELTRHFHAMAGLGGTYGFPRVSQIGSKGEASCNAVVSSGRAPSPAELKHWSWWIDEIRATFAAPQVPDPVIALTRELTPTALLVGGSEPMSDLARDLERLGIEVALAATTAQALEAITKTIPNLVIAEAGQSPATYSLIEQLRANPSANGCMAFLIGRSSEFEDRVEAVRCGADGYFNLPLQHPALLRRVKQMVDGLRRATPRVLYVEDDADHAAFVRAVLENAGYEIRICAESARFESELTAFRPDLVMMDVHLEGEISGYDLARYLRQDERYTTTPLLFITTEAESEGRMKSMQAGADEFLTKPASPSLLLMAVASRIERARMLKALMERDGLTGLLNHSALLDRAKQALLDARRSGVQKALVMLDLDYFKSVNDEYGHPVGDRVLASLGALLSRRLRQTDAVGRYGGEEFALVLDRLSELEAMTLLERLLTEFHSIVHATKDGKPLQVTFSAGIAMVDPSADLDTWKKRADDALYAAKRAGRNRVRASALSPDPQETIH